jgi:hypothetical protein
MACPETAPNPNRAISFSNQHPAALGRLVAHMAHGPKDGPNGATYRNLANQVLQITGIRMPYVAQSAAMIFHCS